MVRSLQTAPLLRTIVADARNLIDYQPPEGATGAPAHFPPFSAGAPRSRLADNYLAFFSPLFFSLFRLNHPENPFYQSPEAREKALAALPLLLSPPALGGRDGGKRSRRTQFLTACRIIAAAGIINNSGGSELPGKIKNSLKKLIAADAKKLIGETVEAAPFLRAASAAALLLANPFISQTTSAVSERLLDYLIESTTGGLQPVDGRPEPESDGLTLAFLGLIRGRDLDEKILPIVEGICVMHRRLIYYDGVSGGGVGLRSANLGSPIGYSFFADASESANLLWHHSRLAISKSVFTPPRYEAGIFAPLYELLELYGVERELASELPGPPREVKRSAEDFDAPALGVALRDRKVYRALIGPGARIESLLLKGPARTVLYSPPTGPGVFSGLLLRTGGGEYAIDASDSASSDYQPERIIHSGKLIKFEADPQELLASEPPAAKGPEPNKRQDASINSRLFFEHDRILLEYSADRATAEISPNRGPFSMRARQVLLLPAADEPGAAIRCADRETPIGDHEESLFGERFDIILGERRLLTIELVLPATLKFYPLPSPCSAGRIAGRPIVLELVLRDLPFSYLIKFPA